MTQDDLARTTKLTQPAIYKLLAGKTQRTTRLAEMAKALKVRPDWLVTGEGPMQGEDLTPDEKEFLTDYRALEPEKRPVARMTLRAMQSTPRPFQAQVSAGQAQTQ